jgi:cytochrome c-type biogenesis protein CcmH
MKRLALLLVLLSTGAALAVSNPAEMMADPAQEHRAEALGHQLRCLVCQNESVEDSEADLARDLRRQIRLHIAAGDSDQQIIDWMVARYGDFVRMNPPFDPVTWLLWGSPVIALLCGGVAVWFGRRRGAAPPPPLSAAERAKLGQILDQP